MVRNVTLVLRPTLTIWLSKPSHLFQPPKSLYPQKLPEHLCFPCTIFLPRPLALCLEARTLLLLLHSVSKIQVSSTRFSVLITCIYLSFFKGPTLCRIKEMDNSMKPRETILHKNWKNSKSVFHKREGKNGVFQCFKVSLTDLEPLVETVSAALFLQASPDSQNDGERRQKSSDHLMWSL